MRAWLLLIAFLPCWFTLLGQQPHEIDNLLSVVRTAAHDSTKIMALCKLSRIDQDKTKKYQYVNEAFTISRNGKWVKGEAWCNGAMGDFYSGSNNAKALEYHLQSLKISEELQDKELIAAALFSIGNDYRLQENYRMALPYFFKVEKIHQNSNSSGRANNYNLIGIAYEKLRKTDSALFYFNRGYEIAAQDQHLFLSRILRGLGNVHTAKGDLELASSFYRKSIAQATAANSSGETSQTYTQFSKLFAEAGNTDSALFYGKEALRIAQNRKTPVLIDWASQQLASVYEGINPNEALRYYKLSAAMKDAVFSAESQAQMQSLTFGELERQRQIEEGKQKEAEERKHNLQYAAIALGVVCFIILFFLLSHTVIANPKLIRFFGVLALLIFFEFLNLLLHPYLGILTHHSPVWMLLLMVCVAAVLIPLHHRLEHWTTHKLVEKNNKIRLAAAKKTIAKLEAQASEAAVANNSDAQHGL